MSDQLESLFLEYSPVAPDPDFRARLVARLQSAAGEGTGAGKTPALAKDVTQPATAIVQAAPQQQRRKGSVRAIATAMTGAAAVLAITVLATRDTTSTRDVAVEPTIPMGTVAPPAESSTTSTVFDNPFSDAEIADRLLLDPDEYATGWQLLQSKNVTLDRTIATTVPGCAAYLDTVFESPERPAVTNHRWFGAPPGRLGAMSQYVVVFPTEAAAMAMFEATTSTRFQADCFQPYKQLAIPDGGFCCDPNDDFPAPLWDGTPATTDTTLGADDLAIRTDNAQQWTDAAGTVHGPELFDSATIRVGRTITVIEAIKVDEFGQPFITDEEFHHAIATASERARHALAGLTG
jgi:hypothetical protein